MISGVSFGFYDTTSKTYYLIGYIALLILSLTLIKRYLIGYDIALCSFLFSPMSSADKGISSLAFNEPLHNHRIIVWSAATLIGNLNSKFLSSKQLYLIATRLPSIIKISVLNYARQFIQLVLRAHFGDDGTLWEFFCTIHTAIETGVDPKRFNSSFFINYSIRDPQLQETEFICCRFWFSLCQELVELMAWLHMGVGVSEFFKLNLLNKIIIGLNLMYLSLTQYLFLFGFSNLIK